MGKKSDLSPECQKFVKKLFAFFSKEKATKKPIVSFDRVYPGADPGFGIRGGVRRRGIWEPLKVKVPSGSRGTNPTPHP